MKMRWRTSSRLSSACVGAPKVGFNMDDRFNRLEQAMESVCKKLSEQLVDSGLRFETDKGMTNVNITDIKIRRKKHGGKGNEVKKSVQQETDIFIIFPEGDSVAAPPVTHEVAAPTAASKIKELKELLDCGAITQEEFDAKKTELLASM
eukprot:gnl/MRDRNA2_/MRDRNA2_23371_c0_seq1.p1 gnl/MRDRNA2_/MRDRNA2_23371_c0~~gnl/MRDRNA2_/MRDRNA2_23371_c0_seq1.p1  ORF type:complete len:149 (-),score=41.31 gnl/MRDRNA2_/MRDRNA2_23371_c0_seq1:22-468(-)